ncbi:MAG: hypothetical protein KUG77_00650 [Nannocystaceae bacterium]|nr:hypothetical protein [Nannocystaceae bacterium]
MAQRPSINRALSLAAALRRKHNAAPEDDGKVPVIEGLAFSTATIRSGGMAVAKIRGVNLQQADLKCESMSSGFIIDVLPQHSVQEEGEQLVLAMRIFRRMGTPRALCLVRVSMGGSSAVASITVRV